MTDSLETVASNLPFNMVIDIDDRSEIVFLVELQSRLARMLENGYRCTNH